MSKKTREEQQKKIAEILENFSNVNFKPEGLGALEFEKEIFSKNFEVETVKFRIERVALQIADKLENEKEDLKATEKILKTFIALPEEARYTDFFELDYDAMKEIIQLISQFQVTPFLFTERARREAETATE